MGVIGFINVPIVHFSVTWWQSLHPGPVIEDGALPGTMLIAFFATMAATLLLTVALVAMRYRIETAADDELWAEPPLAAALAPAGAPQ